MLKSYLTTALRHLRKQRLYTFINVAGLAIGLSAFLLITLFVRYERTYDEFHEKADRIYRVVKEDPGNYYLGSNEFAVTPAPLERALEEKIAGIERATQISHGSGFLRVVDAPAVEDADASEQAGAGAATGGNAFEETGLYASESFFDVFTFPLLHGDADTALSEPESIIISRSLAQKLYGDDDVLGRTLQFRTYGDPQTLTVTGVADDPPQNAHFTFEYLVSMRTNEHWNRNEDRWGNNSWYTYFALEPGADIADVEPRLQQYVHARLADLEWNQDDPENISRFYVQPLTDIHLRSHINFEVGENGDIKFVWLFSAIAVFILLIACINYMNLATARSAQRAREIGIRKVSGAGRGQLVGQFLGESLLISTLAVLLSVGIVWLLLPEFRGLIERQIPISMLFSGKSLLVLAACALGVGLVSGSYPSFLMSRLQPSSVLKGGRSDGRSRSFFRNTLVVTQFTIGIVLIVGTLIVQRQLSFMSAAETGFDREQVVVIDSRDDGLAEQFDTLTDELRTIPGVVAVSTSGHLPTRISSQSGVDDWEGHQEGQEASLYNTSVGYGFFELLDLEFVEGRPFSPDHPSDAEEGLIINETARRAFGWETAVGKTIDFGSRGSRVVGVVKDFHFQSFRQPIDPLALFMSEGRVSDILVRVAPGAVDETVDRIAEVMATFSPAFPFDYRFLDDAYDSMYRADRRFGEIFSWFAGIALAIACLGLFALAAYMAERRTKEIGVRKALGATASDIIVLMSRDIGKLVLIALVVAGPVAWFAMNRWLADFAYRVDFGWQTIAVSGLLALLLAWATVAYQSLKAARTNPVEALRYE